MGKLGKIILSLVAFVVVLFIGLTVVIKMYLTDERIRGIVVPQAEKALDRRVTIGDINVGLLSGISIRDFSIKETDGQTDFVRTKAFVISYNLMPLLQKKLVVSEIRFDNPVVQITRDKKGTFNYASLKVLQQSEQPKEKATGNNGGAAALPIALTVNSIAVRDARLSVRDEKGELPQTDATANISLAVRLGSDLASLSYDGKADVTVDAKHGELTPHAVIQATFDTQKIDYTVNAEVQGEKVTLSGTVNDYTKSPDILADISSDQLNLDRLAALGAAAPKKEAPKTAKKTADKSTKTPIADSLPPGLTAHGTISIAKALYKKLAINNFLLEYQLKDGVFSINDLTANTVGGSLKSAMELDLTKLDPAYSGDLSVQSINLRQLGLGLGQDFADIISGQMQSAINFSGAGFDFASIKKALKAEANYAISDGMIQKTPVTQNLAQILGAPELETINFSDISGTLKMLQGGKISLGTTLKGTQLDAQTQGNVDLDGNLNLPMTLSLSKELMAKIDKGGVSKFLANDQGGSDLKLQVGGTWNKPNLKLDAKAVQKQVEQTIKTKALDELSKKLGGGQQQPATGSDGQQETSKESPAVNLLKGLFGN